MVGGAEIIDDELAAQRGERVTAVVRLSDADLASTAVSNVTETLRDAATRTQRALTTFASEHDGVRIESQFWITNAVVLTVDTARTSLEEITRIPDVKRIHRNFEVEALGDAGPTTDGAATLDHGTSTYGLEQINVPQVWSDFGTKGEGARVAVLDTGIDPDHPDIDLAKWAEFDSNGNQIDSQPYDDNGHGTHTSGTVSGGDASGTHIGVAPNVELYHGGVLTPEGGNFTAVVAGIQWAVEQNADIINMSLGTPSGGYDPDLIEPVQNAKAAGTMPISSSGNSDEGSSGSPANVYDAGMAIGASNSSEGITSFSSGELIDTDQDWGTDAPADWPSEYVVPDVAAPGNSVESSTPGGGYGQKSGTSMAAPHVAGVAALMVAASGGDVTPDQIRAVLESTAWKPDSWDESQANAVIDGKDSRYGKGIVDAYAAVTQVAIDTGVTGIVESEGQPVEGVTVELDGVSATTDSSGAFEILSQPGDYNLTVSGPGITDATVSVTVQDSGSLTDVGTITVDPVLDLFVDTGHPSDIEGGESVSVTLDAYNLETLQVDLTGSYDASNASLSVDGQAVSVGETVAFSDYTGTVSVTVETTADTSGEFGLDHLATGAGEETTVSTGPTTVYALLLDIAVVYDDTSYGSGIVETLDQALPGYFRPVATTTDSIVQNPESFATIVAQKLDGSLVSEFVSATDSADVGVVYLDQWGTDADGISQYAGVSANVTSTSEGYSDGGPYYEATDEHPLFEGVSVDSDVLLHQDSYSDYAFFEAGDGVEVVASTKTDNGVEGDGLAVHEETRTVLAATLGRSYYVEEEDLTEAADTILANAVRYVAGRGTDISAAATYNNGTVEVSIDGTNVGTVTVENLWADWAAADADYSTSFEDAIASDGACTWSWGRSYGWIAPTMTAELPDRYVGGTYALTVSGEDSQGGTAETTVTFEIE